MSREDELERQVQYGSADGAVRLCGPVPLCMQNPTPLSIMCACVERKSKKMISMLPKLALEASEASSTTLNK